jgi:hypothetical protein
MTATLTLLAMLLCCQQATQPRAQLFAAIVEVESHGDCQAVNAAEGAVGPAQIRADYLEDANQQLCSEGLPTYHLREMTSLAKSERVFWAYMRRYGRDLACDEAVARTHVGGPKGPRRAATLAYWAKVQAAMERQAGDE